MKYLKKFNESVYPYIYDKIDLEEVKNIFTDFLDKYGLHDCNLFVQDKNELFRDMICNNKNYSKSEWEKSDWNLKNANSMQSINVIIELPRSRYYSKLCDKINRMGDVAWSDENPIISAIKDRMSDLLGFMFIDLVGVGGDIMFSFVKKQDWLKRMKSSGVDTKAFEEVYYPDLSPHYLMKDLAKSDHPKTKEFLKKNNFVNIGWLDKNHDFPKGEVDPELVKKIKQSKVSCHTKGWHTCEFCDNKDDSWQARSSTEHQIKGKDGKTYCFPEMLIHYITKHNYLPPQEFLDAVRDFIPEPKKEDVRSGGLSAPERKNLENLRRRFK